MKEKTTRILIGVALVAAGVLFMIQQIFNIKLGDLFIGLVFAVGAAIFFTVFFQNRDRWWALIPGFTLLGLAGLIAGGALFPTLVGRAGGPFFLGMIGLSFVAILLVQPKFWWPVIPAGTLLTLAIVAALGDSAETASGAIFFLGIGATFAVLGLLPVGQKQKWPWIPAGVCLILGTVVLLTTGASLNSPIGWIWASVLICVGIFMVIRSLTKKQD